MIKASSILLILLTASIAHAQTPQGKERVPAAIANPCKKSSGMNVFVALDARPTTLANGLQKAHIAPAKSVEIVSQFEAKLSDAGFCVFHNDEFDGAGNVSLSTVAPGVARYISVAFLAHVISFPDAKEILVYSMEYGDWGLVPALPYYLVDESTDASAQAQNLVETTKNFVKH
jgi:hypothetical protein